MKKATLVSQSRGIPTINATLTKKENQFFLIFSGNSEGIGCKVIYD
jgi:hypothetical protein